MATDSAECFVDHAEVCRHWLVVGYALRVVATYDATQHVRCYNLLLLYYLVVSDDAQHNNDLYVFCLFTDTSDRYNVLDLSLWDVYVYPTYRIDNDKHLKVYKTMSLARLNLLGVQKQSFHTLYGEILRVINDISAFYKAI